jgi:hypothetical protein
MGDILFNMESNNQATPLQPAQSNQTDVTNNLNSTQNQSTQPQLLLTQTNKQNNSVPDSLTSSQKKSIISKKLIIFIVVIGVVLGLLSLLSKITGSGIEEAGECFARETEIGDKDFEVINSISDKTERLQYFCKTSEESFKRLIACLETVNSENSTAMSIVEAFPKYKTTLEETIGSHNAACPNSQVTLPQ